MSGYALVNDFVENYVTYEGVFTKDECATIINKLDTDLYKGSVSSKNKPKESVSPKFEVDKFYRNCDVKFFYAEQDKDYQWIYQRLTDVVMNSNNEYFNFNLWGFAEGIQFTKYGVGDYYDMHIDKVYGSVIRKLSVTVQLSDPSEYEGGEVNLFFNQTPEICHKQIGSVTIFPSYVLHKVNPVTKGTRYSLVAWVTGDPFV